MAVSRLPSLESLRVLEVAARHANFTKAADELHVTHGAISQRIKALEADLGVPLFERRGRSMVVTPQGVLLAEHIANGMDEFRRGVRAVTPKSVERLTVSTIAAFATRWLIPRLPMFARAYPDVNVSVQTAMGLSNVSRDGVEIAIRFGEGRWQGVRVEKLFDEYLVPVCSANHDGGSAPAGPAGLLGLPLLHDERQPWSLYFDALGIDVPDALRGPTYNDTNVLLEAAAAGHGVALARATLVSSDLATGRLRRLFDHAVKTRFSYFIVEPPKGARAQAAASFHEWLLGEAAVERGRLGELIARSDSAKGDQRRQG